MDLLFHHSATVAAAEVQLTLLHSRNLTQTLILYPSHWEVLVVIYGVLYI